MVNVTFTIPDAQVNRYINAFAVMYNYQTEVPDGNGGMIPNPQTKAQFAKQCVVNYMKEIVKACEVQEAVETARTTAASATQVDVS